MISLLGELKDECLVIGLRMTNFHQTDVLPLVALVLKSPRAAIPGQLAKNQVNQRSQKENGHQLMRTHCNYV